MPIDPKHPLEDDDWEDHYEFDLTGAKPVPPSHGMPNPKYQALHEEFWRAYRAHRKAYRARHNLPEPEEKSAATSPKPILPAQPASHKKLPGEVGLALGNKMAARLEKKAAEKEAAQAASKKPVAAPPVQPLPVQPTQKPHQPIPGAVTLKEWLRQNPGEKPLHPQARLLPDAPQSAPRGRLTNLQRDQVPVTHLQRDRVPKTQVLTYDGGESTPVGRLKSWVESMKRRNKRTPRIDAAPLTPTKRPPLPEDMKKPLPRKLKGKIDLPPLLDLTSAKPKPKRPLDDQGQGPNLRPWPQLPAPAPGPAPLPPSQPGVPGTYLSNRPPSYAAAPSPLPAQPAPRARGQSSVPTSAPRPVRMPNMQIGPPTGRGRRAVPGQAHPLSSPTGAPAQMSGATRGPRRRNLPGANNANPTANLAQRLNATGGPLPSQLGTSQQRIPPNLGSQDRMVGLLERMLGEMKSDGKERAKAVKARKCCPDKILGFLARQVGAIAAGVGGSSGASARGGTC